MRYEFHTKSHVEEGIQRGTLEYQAAEPIPILKSVVGEGKAQVVGKAWSFGKEVRLFSNFQYNGAVDDEQFRLGFYGMPEPRGVVWEPRPRWYLWLIAVACLCLVVAAYFRHRLQKRKRMLAQECAKSEMSM